MSNQFGERYGIRLMVRSGCGTELIRLTARSSANGKERLRYGMDSVGGAEFGQRYSAFAVRNGFGKRYGIRLAVRKGGCTELIRLRGPFRTQNPRKSQKMVRTEIVHTSGFLFCF